MAKFITLGCGSAMPLPDRQNASHVLFLNDKVYMIDCGEGAQSLLHKADVKVDRINNLFISHLHGDHIFGLLPLLSTMSMKGRLAPLTVFAHKDLREIMEPLKRFFLSDLSFELRFADINPHSSDKIFEDSKNEVYTIPLKHSIETCGFLFREKKRGRNIIKNKMDEYGIPLSAVPDLRSGKDFVTSDGTVIPNGELTIEPRRQKSFAYCSDTVYMERIVEQIRGVDLLYHEATYGDTDKDKIRRGRMHSTARQAAEIARKADVGTLVIGHYSSRYRTEDDIRKLEKEAREVFANTFASHDVNVFNF